MLTRIVAVAAVLFASAGSARADHVTWTFHGDRPGPAAKLARVVTAPVRLAARVVTAPARIVTGRVVARAAVRGGTTYFFAPTPIAPAALPLRLSASAGGCQNGQCDLPARR